MDNNFSATGAKFTNLGSGIVAAPKAQNLTVADDTAVVLELGLTNMQRVGRFMVAMEQDIPDQPAWPDEKTFRLRVRLDLEEMFEKIHDGYYLGDPLQILDGACDIDYVNVGSILTFGINYELSLAEVDRSNISKLGTDGKPIRREDGKVMKGPNYSPPNLKQFLHDIPLQAPYDTKTIVREELQAVVAKYYAISPDMFTGTVAVVDNSNFEPIEGEGLPHFRV